MFAPRRAATSSASCAASSSTSTKAASQWHRKWRATSTRSFSRSYDSAVDTSLPYAETSAAAAARARVTPSWQQRNFFSSAAPSLSAVALGKQRAWAVDTSEEATTSSATLQASAPPGEEATGPDWSTTSDEVGWSTPEEIAHSGNDDPSSLLTHDRSLIDYSAHHMVLSLAYDFAEPYVQEHLTTGRIRSPGALREQAEKIFDDLYDKLGAQIESDSWSATVQPFTAADRRAFQTAFVAMLRLLVVMRAPKRDILEKLDDLKRWLGPLPLQYYHRVAAVAGRRDQPRLVTELVAHAMDSWGGRTDEWLLYARARAIATSDSGARELRDFWSVYERYSGMQGSPRTAMRAAMRALEPPRCLFTFLLEHFAAHAQVDERRSLMIDVVNAMRSFGHGVDEGVWLKLVRANLTLRGHIAQEISQDGSGSETGYLLALLGQRTEALASLDVVRMLRIIDATTLDTGASELFSAAQRAEAYTLAIEMFGRLEQPWRASVLLRRAWAQADEQQKERGVVATMMAYASTKRAEEGLALARHVIGEITEEARTNVDLTPGITLSDRLFTAMFRCAALLPDYKTKADEGYRLLNMVTTQSQTEVRKAQGPVLRGLVAYLFAAVGTSHRWEIASLQTLLARLGALAKEKAIVSPIVELRLRQSKTPDPPKLITCTFQAGRAIAAVLRYARRMGLKQVMEAKTHRRIWWEEQVNARQWERERERRGWHEAALGQGSAGNAEAIDWLRSGSEDALLQDDLSHSTAAADVAGDVPAPQEMLASKTAPATKAQQAAMQNQSRAVRALRVIEPASPPRRRLHPSQDPSFQADLSRPLSRPAYAHRLRVYAVIRRDHIAAAYIYRSMLSHSVRPSMHHVSLIVEGLALDGRLDEARAITRAAQQSLGLAPNARIRAILMRELIRRGRTEEAREEWREHLAAGGRVNAEIEALFAPRPTLADPLRARKAFQIARRKQEALSIAEVDEAFRWLCDRRRLVSAHRLLVLALLSGTRFDWEAIKRVVDKGNWIWKLLGRRGIAVRASSIAGLSSARERRSKAASTQHAAGEPQWQPPVGDEARAARLHVADEDQVNDAAVAQAVRADADSPDEATQLRLDELTQLYDAVSSLDASPRFPIEDDPLFSPRFAEAEDAAFAAFENDGGGDGSAPNIAYGETSSSDLREAWLLNRAVIFLSKRVVAKQERRDLFAQKWFLVEVERLLIAAAEGKWDAERFEGGGRPGKAKREELRQRRGGETLEAKGGVQAEELRS